jgi:hypothetical protein
MRSNIVPGGVFPTMSCLTTRKPCGAERAARRRPADPHPFPRPLLPEGHQQHLQLAAFYPQIAVAYTQIATIATDDITPSRSSACRSAPSGRSSQIRSARSSRPRHQGYTDPDHDPMIPYTLVLKPGLVIHSIYNGYWFWGRPSVEDLRQDLRAVRARPPRLGSERPGLREAWNAGELSPFHGWNRWVVVKMVLSWCELSYVVPTTQPATATPCWRPFHHDR